MPAGFPFILSGRGCLVAYQVAGADAASSRPSFIFSAASFNAGRMRELTFYTPRQLTFYTPPEAHIRTAERNTERNVEREIRA